MLAEDKGSEGTRRPQGSKVPYFQTRTLRGTSKQSWAREFLKTLSHKRKQKSVLATYTQVGILPVQRTVSGGTAQSPPLQFQAKSLLPYIKQLSII